MLLLTRSLIVNAETINIPDLKLRAVIEMALNKEVGGRYNSGRYGKVRIS